MNEDGKKVEFLAEVDKYREEAGVMIPGHSITAWADENMKPVIESVAGVTNVYNGQPTKTQFHIYVDHRYDVNFVLSEIEKAVLKAGAL